jgi:hypothetical protein
MDNKDVNKTIKVVNFPQWEPSKAFILSHSKQHKVRKAVTEQATLIVSNSPIAAIQS